MQGLRKNIGLIYGDNGKQWLDKLLEISSKIAKERNLSGLEPVNNMTFNYVASGYQGDDPIILKLGIDSKSLKQEAFALKCFAGYGAVKVIAEDDGMLLLERILPSISLKSYFPDKEQESIEIACRVMKKLHQAIFPAAHNFLHIKDWLTALDTDWNIPDGYLKKARQFRDQLLKTTGSDVLLHGDLHHDNILQNGCDWLVIDPKGVIGEPAYEVAAFIRNPMPELPHHADAPNIIHNRITHFAKALELSERRIIDWCFVQAALAWAWALEDGCDTNYFEQLTKIFEQDIMNL